MHVELINEREDNKKESEKRYSKVGLLESKKEFEVGRIELAEGNRPGKIFLNSGFFEIGFIVWEKGGYARITPPNKTSVEKKGNNGKKYYNSYYNTVIEGSEKDNEIEDLASMVLVAYHIAKGDYGNVLKKRLKELNINEYKAHCSSCHHNTKAEYSKKNPQGTTDDKNNIRFCQVNNSIIEDLVDDDRKEDINYRRNRDYINHRYYGLESCPYYNKSYFNQKTQTNIKERSAPFFPIDKYKTADGDNIYKISTIKYDLDITNAVKKRRFKIQINYFTKEFKNLVKSFNREQVGKVVHKRIPDYINKQVVYATIRELFRRYGKETKEEGVN